MYHSKCAFCSVGVEQRRGRAIPAMGVEVVFTARICVQDLWWYRACFAQGEPICRYFDVEVVLALDSKGTQVVKRRGLFEHRLRELVNVR